MEKKLCVLPTCTSHLKNGIRASLHRFPIDHTRRERWIEAIKTSSWDPVIFDDSRICSIHFDQTNLRNIGQYTSLIPGAVPTKVEFDTTAKPIMKMSISSDISNVATSLSTTQLKNEKSSNSLLRKHTNLICSSIPTIQHAPNTIVEKLKQKYQCRIKVIRQAQKNKLKTIQQMNGQQNKGRSKSGNFFELKEKYLIPVQPNKVLKMRRSLFKLNNIRKRMKNIANNYNGQISNSQKSGTFFNIANQHNKKETKRLNFFNSGVIKNSPQANVNIKSMSNVLVESSVTNVNEKELSTMSSSSTNFSTYDQKKKKYSASSFDKSDLKTYGRKRNIFLEAQTYDKIKQRRKESAILKLQKLECPDFYVIDSENDDIILVEDDEEINCKGNLQDVHHTTKLRDWDTNQICLEQSVEHNKANINDNIVVESDKKKQNDFPINSFDPEETNDVFDFVSYFGLNNQIVFNINDNSVSQKHLNSEKIINNNRNTKTNFVTSKTPEKISESDIENSKVQFADDGTKCPIAKSPNIKIQLDKSKLSGLDLEDEIDETTKKENLIKSIESVRNNSTSNNDRNFFIKGFLEYLVDDIKCSDSDFATNYWRTKISRIKNRTNFIPKSTFTRGDLEKQNKINESTSPQNKVASSQEELPIDFDFIEVNDEETNLKHLYQQSLKMVSNGKCSPESLQFEERNLTLIENDPLGMNSKCMKADDVITKSTVQIDATNNAQHNASNKLFSMSNEFNSSKKRNNSDVVNNFKIRKCTIKVRKCIMIDKYVSGIKSNKCRKSIQTENLFKKKYEINSNIDKTEKEECVLGTFMETTEESKNVKSSNKYSKNDLNAATRERLNECELNRNVNETMYEANNSKCEKDKAPINTENSEFNLEYDKQMSSVISDYAGMKKQNNIKIFDQFSSLIKKGEPSKTDLKKSLEYRNSTLSIPNLQKTIDEVSKSHIKTSNTTSSYYKEISKTSKTNTSIDGVGSEHLTDNIEENITFHVIKCIESKNRSNKICSDGNGSELTSTKIVLNNPQPQFVTVLHNTAENLNISKTFTGENNNSNSDIGNTNKINLDKSYEFLKSSLKNQNLLSEKHKINSYVRNNNVNKQVNPAINDIMGDIQEINIDDIEKNLKEEILEVNKVQAFNNNSVSILFNNKAVTQHILAPKKNSIAINLFEIGDFIAFESELNLKEWPTIWEVTSSTTIRYYEPVFENNKLVYKSTTHKQSFTKKKRNECRKVCVTIQSTEHGIKTVILHRTEIDCIYGTSFKKSLVKYDTLREPFFKYVLTIVSQAVDFSFFQMAFEGNNFNIMSKILFIDNIITKAVERCKMCLNWSNFNHNSIEELYFCVCMFPSQKDRNKRKCFKCTVENIKNCLLFSGQPYNKLTLKPTNSNTSKWVETKFYLCLDCSQNISLVHKLVHTKYSLYVKCIKKLADIRNSNEAAISAKEILVCILNDTSWLENQFLDFAQNLAEVDFLEMELD